MRRFCPKSKMHTNSPVVVNKDSQAVREENNHTYRERIPGELRKLSAQLGKNLKTHVWLAPVSVHLDLLDLANNVPRRLIVLRVVFVFLLRVHRALVPPWNLSASPSVTPAQQTHRMYVNSIPAHDCSEATLATATSQTNAYKVSISDAPGRRSGGTHSLGTAIVERAEEAQQPDRR